jgi:hypothetical protein
MTYYRIEDATTPHASRLSKLKQKAFPKLNQGIKVKIREVHTDIDSIPKIIHQTFYTKVLPIELQKNIEKIRSLNPEWEYKLYDDSDVIEFIEDNYDPHVLQYFLRIDRRYGAARADLFRYLLIYKIGGIYLDIKASMCKPLDKVLQTDDSFILAQWNDSGQFKQWGTHYDLAHVDGGEFQQWHIAARPGHPFLKATIESVLANIDRYNPSLHGTGKTGVIKVTGPVAYTAAIAPLLGIYPHRLLKDHREMGFIYSVYNDESGSHINEIHKTSFRSHYSQLTHPIITLSMKKRALARITGTISNIHTLTLKANIYRRVRN